MNVDALAQTIRIRDLPTLATPAAGDYVAVGAAAGGTYKATLGSLSSGVGGGVPTSRIIACTPPLLCNGGTSTTLASTVTLSLSALYGNVATVACTNNATADTAAISSALTSLTSAGGGKLHLSGSCIRTGDIVNNPAAGVTSHLLIEGDGRSATTLSFTSCTSSCIYLGEQSGVGSGRADGSGIRDLTVVAPSTKDAITLANLENFIVSGVYTYSGLTALTISESRAGTIQNLKLNSWTANGIKIVGESFAANFFRDITIVTGSATGSGVNYTKTGTTDAGGAYFSNVVVNGTMSGSGFLFTNTTANNMFIFCDTCVADGNFSADGFRIVKALNVFLQGPFAVNQASATNSAGITLDAVSEAVIAGGAAYANTGASGADLSFKNTVTKTSISGIRLSGPVTSLKVDSTTHDVDFRPSEMLGSTTISDPTKLAASASRQYPAATAATSNQFLTAYDAVAGTFTKAQPSFSNLSGSATCAQIPALTSDVTTSAGSCTTSLNSAYKGWTDAGATLSTTTATDKVGIGTSAPDSLLSISGASTALPSPLTGTILHLGNADSTAPRMGLHAFAANGSIDFIRADTGISAPSIISSTEVIGQLAGFGYDGSGYTSTGRVNVQLRADGTWSSGSTPTSLAFGTTLSGQTGLRTVMVLDNGGHVVFSDSTGSPTVSCTGTGTSPAAPTLAGTDNNFIVTINTGTGTPSSTGTCTVTFAHSNLANAPVMACMLVKGASTWGNGATIQLTTESTSAPVFTWTNLVGGTATALTVSTSYKFSCVSFGRG